MLIVALDVILTKGYSATTVAEICRNAGVDRDLEIIISSLWNFRICFKQTPLIFLDYPGAIFNQVIIRSP
jgi:hypothetical protein